jgi:hypothetical protein
MSEFHPQLLWRRTFRNRGRAAPATPNWSDFPSWSWASIGVDLQWPKHLFYFGEDYHMCSMETGSITDSNYSLCISGLPLKLHEEDLRDMELEIEFRGTMDRVRLPRITLSCVYILDAWYLHRILGLASGDRYACLQSVVEATAILPVLWTDYEGPETEGSE